MQVKHNNGKFYAESVQEYNYCGETFLHLKGGFYRPPYPTFESEGGHKIDDCFDCQENRLILLNQLEDEVGRFPFCCDAHKKLNLLPDFNIHDYSKSAVMIANKVMFTHSHILNNIDSENWEWEIKDYLDYTIRSFGSFPYKYGEPLKLSFYFDRVYSLLEGIKLPKEAKNSKVIYSRIVKIKNFIDAIRKGEQKAEGSDFSELLDVYQKWLQIFPFDLEFFEGLESQFKYTLPFLEGKPRTNKYTGMKTGKLISKQKLIKILTIRTTEVLTRLNSLSHYKEGRLTNSDKTLLDIIIKSREIELEKFKSTPEDNLEYLEIIQQWLQEEENFLGKITPMLKTLPSHPLQKKEKLSLPQIALIHIYTGRQITRDNGKEIANQYGWTAKNSGEKLYQKFNKYFKPTDRKGNEGTKLKNENKIKLIESVIELLPADKQNRAKDEVSILKNILETEYK